MAERANDWAEARRAGEAIDVASHMSHLTLEVVGETLFGSAISKEAHEIAESLSTLLNISRGAMLPFWRVLRHLPIPMNRRIAQSRKRLDDIILGLIAARRGGRERSQ